MTEPTLSQVQTRPEHRSAVGLPVPETYKFGPFTFRSELEIPELRGVEGSGRIPVTIRLGGVPERLSAGIPDEIGCQVTATEFLLPIKGVARYYVGHGHDVRVEPYPGTAICDISTYLLGSVFGTLCHQNGLLPLHASALETGGRVTAFLGDSGAGKSTMAACFRRRGFGIVSDDICLLEPQPESGEMRVVPVAGWLKLWRESLDHLGELPEESNRVFSTDDKYRLYLNGRSHERPVLANLIFLERAESAAEAPRLERLSTATTIALMMRCTYLDYVVDLTESHARIFRQCASVLASATGFRLVVPWGFDRMEDVLDLVQSSLLGGSHG